MSNELVNLVTTNEKLEENIEKYKTLSIEFKVYKFVFPYITIYIDDSSNMYISYYRI